MTDFLRILLLLALAGATLTATASITAWWMEEDRRLTRIMSRVLDGVPDAAIIAKGRNASAAFRLETEQVLVLWNGGRNALLYPMSSLLGAELIVDQAVAARVYRGEPRRALDVVNSGARQVVLRLIFDNPKDPDFELELWTTRDESARGSPGPSAAITEARTWIARADAILRRPVSQAVVTAQTPAPADEDDEAPF